MARRTLSTLTPAAVAVMFTVFLPCTQLQAQTQATSATLSGTVSDPSGGIGDSAAQRCRSRLSLGLQLSARQEDGEHHSYCRRGQRGQSSARHKPASKLLAELSIPDISNCNGELYSCFRRGNR